MNILFAGILFAEALVVPSPAVMFRPAAIRAEEKPVIVETAQAVAEDDGLFRRVETTITFTNPNSRVFEGELEFPVPEGATVCGYALEVNGSMVPGVVVPKETARVAFENEKKKGVDPGIVENVKGNVWKTRIYPLMPRTPRKAMVAYVEPCWNSSIRRSADSSIRRFVDSSIRDGDKVCEKCGDEVFIGEYVGKREVESKVDRLRRAVKATIYWDASMSRNGKTAADRALLEVLPDSGEFTLVVFRNVIEAPAVFATRAELLAAVDALVYDGGTAIGKIEKLIESAGEGERFVFSDEWVERKAREIAVRRLEPGEAAPVEPKSGTLLATAWAMYRVEDLEADADAHRRELEELGRKYGVASKVTSLIVLDTLKQYQDYKIEPPKTMSFYEEWKKSRAAEDDPIAAEKAKADHRTRLLGYWEERVKWWNDPVPPKRTPKSGLFDNAERGAAPAMMSMSATETEDVMEIEEASAPMVRSARAMAEPSPVAMNSVAGSVRKSARSSDQNAPHAASVKIAAWDPKMPYLAAIKAAPAGGAYTAYLKERDVYGTSPAFYLDCAGWFFKAGETALGARIISNLSEMKLEDVGMWRTMGWRLREAGLYHEAIEAFRHVLAMRPEEPQSKRDLALVLTEFVKNSFRNNAGDNNASCFMLHVSLEEAARLLLSAAFDPTARRSGRRGNDMQTSVLALEELNGIFAWVKANGVEAKLPELDAAFRRDLPCELRIMLSWDTDETDVDLHVLEPDGEEAFYGHRRTSTGGFVSEDVTTGYGPEEYLRKTADKGVYRILANYFASHRQQLTGAATITATVYTNWGTDKETREIMSLRLDKPKDKHPIGEITIR